MKPTQTFPIILMGLFALIVSSITVAVISAMDQFGQWQNHKEITASILQGDETAIKTLEGSAPEIQKQILDDEEVKNALVRFYIQQTENPLSVISETYDDAIEGEILNGELVYRTLMAHYYEQIDVEVEGDNFKQAFLMLDTLKNAYPHSKEWTDKEQDLQNKKQQRLALLIQKYTECLEQTLAPLLERTHCMVEARQKIERVGIEHRLPTDSNLPIMYADEIKQALGEKNYEHAETLLLDWQNLLPESSEQRELLQKRLALHQQRQNIIADLTDYDNQKVMKRLTQLIIAPDLENEVLQIPEVQKNLLKYHLKKALVLMTETEIEPLTKVRLKTLLAQAPRQAQSRPWYATQNVAELLQECQAHFQAKRLTSGQEGTALDCYRAVLKKEPGNRDALKGLQAIEKRYKAWAETALQENKPDKVKVFIANLKKVNPNSQSLAPLRQALEGTQVQQEAKLSPPPPPAASPTCEDCNCSTLLRQLSVGLKPLTAEENDFFQNQCR